MSKWLKNVCSSSDFQQEIQCSNIRINNIITVCMKTYWSLYNEIFKSALLESDHRDILNTHGERILCKGNHVFCQVFLCMNGLPGHHRLRTKYRRAVFRGREMRLRRYFLFFPLNMQVSPISLPLLQAGAPQKQFHQNLLYHYCIIVSWYGLLLCIYSTQEWAGCLRGVAIAKAILSFSCRIVFVSSQHSGKHASFSSVLAAIFKWRCLNLLASGSMCVCLIGAEDWLTHQKAEAWASCCAWDHVLVRTIRSNLRQSIRCQFFGSVISTSRYYEKHGKMKTVAVLLTRRIV